ncbi:hypothetical protein HYALB_00011138 [Hymenoscyphus albidus]|uniref:Protein kinase domain-containing protein n=1 Tax=Hymenoscyphus albidus TaxID=595503 RepID=A0A9N9LPG3_9HELO|nr:hypothetical protein HYALB_00011138 [Hymenoscyphus albidus]
MADERAMITDFEERTRDSWTSLGGYDTVAALLIYWAEDDLNVKPEVERLEDLLRRHADNADETAPAGYSEWRALEQGGPSINWFEIQPSLYAAEGDVLVILDCCHAALRTSGTKKGKMEVLAASASGSRVPAPGRLSFTSVLIRQIRKRLQSRQGFSLRWLHKHLWDDTTHPGLTETPIYFDLSEHDERSIILSPLIARPPEGFAKKRAVPAAYVILTVSLADDPTGLQIANWLRSFPPPTAQDVDIEALVLKARKIEGLKNIESLFTGSILGKISRSAQVEITERLSALSGAVSDAATVAATTVTGPSYAKRAINELETNVSAVCDAIEGSLLLDSNVDLEAAVRDEVSITIGATQALNLRQYLLGKYKIPDTPEIPRISINFKPSTQAWKKKRFRYGFIEEKPVIVETFQVPLEARVHLASTLGIAVENLHRVGWLHKELKSENVLFFKKSVPRNMEGRADTINSPDRMEDFGHPWLLGFEYSRAEEAATHLESDYSLVNNAYRHPERWGKPTVKFERSHDVYALGILLLEVAFWKPIQQFRELKNTKVNPWVVKEDLLKRVNQDCPHMVGQNFSDAIDTCFQFKELTSGLNEFEAHKVLKEKILGKLQKAAGNL